MEETTPGLSVAKVALLSSLFTLIIVAGAAFICREFVLNYLKTELAVTTGTTIQPILPAEQPLVEMIARVNAAVVSVVITKNVPVYEQYYETFDPWGFFNFPQVRENGTEERDYGAGLSSESGASCTHVHTLSY